MALASARGRIDIAVPDCIMIILLLPPEDIDQTDDSIGHRRQPLAVEVRDLRWVGQARVWDKETELSLTTDRYRSCLDFLLVSIILLAHADLSMGSSCIDVAIDHRVLIELSMAIQVCMCFELL